MYRLFKLHGLSSRAGHACCVRLFFSFSPFLQTPAGAPFLFRTWCGAY